MHQDCYVLKIVEFHSFLVISKIHPFFFNPVPFWHIQWIQWWTWLLKQKRNNWNIFFKTVSFFLPKTDCLWDTSFSNAVQLQSCVWVSFHRIFWLCNNSITQNFIYSKTFDRFTISYAKLIFVTWRLNVSIWILHCTL